MRSVSMTILAFGALLAVGCSSQTSEPVSGASWDWVRLHEGGSETYSDLSIGANGEFALDMSSRGGVSPARGLLAGERLETLARLIGELPLGSYSSPGSCDGDFFLSVTRDGDVTTYRANDCDSSIPASLDALRGLLSDLAVGISDPQRPDPDAARVLASGTSSSIAETRVVVIDDRDELFALLRQHRPGGIVAMPPVDFAKEVVVGIFSAAPTSGYALGLGPVESAENGWSTVEILETSPGDRCLVTEATTEPFLLLAVKRPSGGLVLNRRTEIRRCD